MNLETWIRQPSTLHGLAVIAGAAGGALAHVATGNTTIDAIVGIGAYVLVHLGVDDNSGQQAAITTALTDAVDAVQGHQVATQKLLTDATTAVQAVQAVIAPPAAAVTIVDVASTPAVVAAPGAAP